MGKTKKLIALDDKAIAILEKLAKLQKRSLKNYIEYTLEDTALRYSEPSEDYKKMMDEKLRKLENGTLKTVSLKEVLSRYDR